MNVLNKDLIYDPSNNDITQAITRIEEEIYQQKQEKINASIFRSRVNWHQNGDKPSRYFLNLEKRNYFSKNMRAVEKCDGTICKEQKEILKEQTKFYRKLYAENKNVIFNLHPTESERILSESEKCLMDSQLTIEDLRTSVKEMAPNKTPGLDGLNKEFYEQFFDILSESLLDMYKYCWEVGEFAPSTRTGLITLIPKKDKNICKLSAWRALTMLNLDFKILAKTLATRLKIILPNIIGEEQCGFMKGRNIQECLMRTIEVIRYTKQKKIPAMIIQLDFEKCFDKIQHPSIIGAFKYFNFGDTFIRWIRLFFTKMRIHTQNFGFLSPAFIKEAGTNQGCNISPFCFLLCGEIMNRKLKANKNVNGIEVDGIRTLISQFADDTTLFLKLDKICVDAVISTLAEIECNTGLTINYDKTMIYRIGSMARSNAKIYTIKELNWCDNTFESLGVEFCNDLEKMSRINYDKILPKVHKVIENWGQQQGTILGRIVITNTLMESLFVYKLSVLPDMDEKTIVKLESQIDKYIWMGKKARIARKTLQSPKNCGGQRLFDFRNKQSALKLQWVNRISTSKFFWEAFIRNTGLPNSKNILRCNLSEKDFNKIKGSTTKNFWTQFFAKWCKVNFVDFVEDYENILSQIVWFNSLIKNKGKPLMCRGSILNDQEILKIRDIWSVENKKFLTFQEFHLKKPNSGLTWLDSI